MKNNLKKKISKSIFTVIIALISATGFSAEKNINLKDMGSFTVGGKVYQEKMEVHFMEIMHMFSILFQFMRESIP